MRYASVCSGIEAASVAWAPLSWDAEFFAEINRFPCEVLAHRYGSNLPGEELSRNAPPNLGDITRFQEWPDAAFDLLVGGTPCQSFSVAGLRRGLADPRGNLALTYLGIADRYRPRWIVWENVPGVLSSHGGRDFGAFLGGLAELGYGWAYRVLDAQYVRVDGYGRAVPQRRRRVFVVGCLGDWRRAAAVLFERESLSGNPAPRREARQRVAGTVAGGARGRGGYSTDDVPLTEAFGGNRQSGPLDVATAVNAHGGPHGRTDFESETFVCAPPLTRNPYGDHESREGLLVAHSRRADGFDASEDGTGRGTPLIPVPFTLAIRGREGEHQLEYRQDGTANAILTPNGGRAGIGVGAIAFDTTQITSAANYSQPKAGDPCHPLAAQAHPPAIAFDCKAGGDTGFSIGEVPGALRGEGHGGGHAAIASGWAVRRLTPVECERLQGFPDGYTDIPRTTGKPAADGPRYKALGNSMAVNVMRWIGRRIELVEALEAMEKAA